MLFSWLSVSARILMILDLFACFYWWFRPMLKWIIRKTTGKCELLRITLATTHRYDRAHEIGNHAVT